MGLRRKDDTPRVVGFEFGPPAAPAPGPAPVAPQPVPPPPAAPYAPPAPPAAPYAPPAPPAAPYAPPAPPVPAGAAPFVPPGPVATAPYLPPPPAPPVAPFPTFLPPQATPSQRDRAFLVAGVVLAVAVLAGALGFTFLSGSDSPDRSDVAPLSRPERALVTAPEVVDGARRVTSGPLMELAQSFTDDEVSTAAEGEVIGGLYARGEVPAFVLFATSSKLPVGTMHAWFKEETGKGGGTVSSVKAVGQDLRCASLTRGRMETWACFWSGPISSGYLMDVTGGELPNTARLTRLARGDVEL